MHVFLRTVYDCACAGIGSMTASTTEYLKLPKSQSQSLWWRTAETAASITCFTLDLSCANSDLCLLNQANRNKKATKLLILNVLQQKTGQQAVLRTYQCFIIWKILYAPVSRNRPRGGAFTVNLSLRHLDPVDRFGVLWYGSTTVLWGMSRAKWCCACCPKACDSLTGYQWCRFSVLWIQTLQGEPELLRRPQYPRN